MALIPFSQDIPQGTDEPSQSQPLILQNFQGDYDIWNINHYTFDNDPNAGKHKFVQLPVQAADPVISATEMALYTKDVAGTPQMFIERGAGTVVPMTTKFEGASTLAASRGYSYLPSGILMVWGTMNVTAIAAPANFDIDFSGFAPAFSAARMNVQVTLRLNDTNADPNLALYIRSILSASSFRIRSFSRTGGAVPAGNFTFTWVAIGPGV